MAKRPHVLVPGCLFVLVVGGYALMALRYPMAYIWATYEDLIGEWSQTYFFLAAGVLSGWVALESRRYRWFFIVLAVACSYVVLEEISWGQRLFGFSTPDFLAERNLQGEANLHNLLTGPHKTLLKDVISVILAIGLAGYGLVYPLAQRARWRLATWLDRIGIATPPLALAPFFTLAALFELKPLSFNEAEIAELLVSMALAMFALQYLAAHRRSIPTPRCVMSRNDSLVIGSWMIMLCAAVVFVAGLTTVGFYSVPANKIRVDNRIENGVEKFAGRYERYDRCDVALGLYGKLLAKEPERVYILRKKAACHRELGEFEAFTNVVTRAIEIDLRKFDTEPWRASTNQSLVRSYRLAGDTDSADAHLAKAMEIGLARLLEHPRSPSAAYSYGRTLQLAGQDEAAFEQFARAYELDPTSARYRRAYYASRAVLDRSSADVPSVPGGAAAGTTGLP